MCFFVPSAQFGVVQPFGNERFVFFEGINVTALFILFFGGNAGTKNVCITREEDGAYIRIPLVLACGDTLTVSTLPGAKYILHNGESCMRFDRGSTFFSLLRGKNTLRITADAALSVPDARLQFRCRHFGV